LPVQRRHHMAQVTYVTSAIGMMITGASAEPFTNLVPAVYTIIAEDLAEYSSRTGRVA